MPSFSKLVVGSALASVAMAGAPDEVLAVLLPPIDDGSALAPTCLNVKHEYESNRCCESEPSKLTGGFLTTCENPLLVIHPGRKREQTDAQWYARAVGVYRSVGERRDAFVGDFDVAARCQTEAEIFREPRCIASTLYSVAESLAYIAGQGEAVVNEPWFSRDIFTNDLMFLGIAEYVMMPGYALIDPFQQEEQFMARAMAGLANVVSQTKTKGAQLMRFRGQAGLDNGVGLLYMDKFVWQTTYEQPVMSLINVRSVRTSNDDPVAPAASSTAHTYRIVAHSPEWTAADREQVRTWVWLTKPNEGESCKINGSWRNGCTADDCEVCDIDYYPTWDERGRVDRVVTVDDKLYFVFDVELETAAESVNFLVRGPNGFDTGDVRTNSPLVGKLKQANPYHTLLPMAQAPHALAKMQPKFSSDYVAKHFPIVDEFGTDQC